jgi:predicted Na+-dependent transporter
VPVNNALRISDHSLSPLDPVTRIISVATNLFPVWVLLGGALALISPAWLTWFNGDCITWGLAVIMPGMGMPSAVCCAAMN